MYPQNMKINRYPPALKSMLDISPEKILKLLRFVELIHEYNKRFNLISKTDVNKLWENHILPSLIVLNLVEFPCGADVLDVGSGAGLPGIPIKILRPDLNMCLIDSVRKKVLFQRRVKDCLGLSDLYLYNSRLGIDPEPIAFKEKFFIVLARAVTSIENLYSLTHKMLQNKGFLLLWKGIDDLEELEKTKRKFNLMSEIIEPPEKFQKLSAKIKTMRFIKIFS
jgi:16S rRNA (guanine527-N7)-methyltransferase